MNTSMQEKLRPIFETIHRHPELGLEEYETTALIRRELEAAGIEILPTESLRTGLVAAVRGGKPGRTIALRCDMDALPVQEESGLPYASEIPGRMHACGHDFHTTAMLGAALLLKQREKELAGTVKIIFQPAEEISDGADRVIATGAVDDAELFAALHTYPGFENGTLGIKEGPVMAAVDYFGIRLRGKGAHAGLPHKGIDPIPVVAQLVLALQTIVSRRIDPFDDAVLSVTHIDAGTTWNVVPETAFIEGTVRSLDPKVRKKLEDDLRQMTEHIAAASGLTSEIEWTAGPGAVINDAGLCAVAREVALEQGFRVERQEDTNGAEDFACYSKTGRPILFVRVGTGGGWTNHHPKFTADPEALSPAAGYFAALAERLLKE